METRARHLLIGAFVLISVVALFGFVIWLAKVEIDREFAYYKIFFQSSVAGLGVGGDVRYHGIKVGKVVDIAIDPDDPTRVGVTVEVGKDTPIRDADLASMQLQGVTGLSYINIDGADASSALLVYDSGEPPPVIQSKRSGIQELVMSAPELINRGILLAERFADLFDDENRGRVKDILRNLDTLSGSLASRSENLGHIIESLDTTSAELAQSVRAVRVFADKAVVLVDQAGGVVGAAEGAVAGADRIIRRDLKRTLADVSKAADGVGNLAASAEGLFADNRDSIRGFTGDGLAEFKRFVSEARILVSGLARLTERVESDGAARFLFGEQESEFEVER